MSSKDMKDLRKQLRNVVKEILPEILTQEQYLELKKHIDKNIKNIEKIVKDSMHEMNNRQKDTLDYLVRNTVAEKKD